MLRDHLIMIPSTFRRLPSLLPYLQDLTDRENIANGRLRVAESVATRTLRGQMMGQNQARFSSTINEIATHSRVGSCS